MITPISLHNLVLFNLFFYVAYVWLELTFIVIVFVVVALFIGYKLRIIWFLHFLRRTFIIHYIVGENRLTSNVVLEKELKTLGNSRFIPTKTMWYKINKNRFFLSGIDVATAHLINDPDPLTFADIKQHIPNVRNMFAQDGTRNEKISAQETESAIDSKVVIDLNKSIYGRQDLIMFIAIGFLGIMLIICIYYLYQQQQELTSIIAYLNKIAGYITEYITRT